MSIEINSPEDQELPQVIIDEQASQRYAVSSSEVARTLEEAGVSPGTIPNVTLDISSDKRFNGGTFVPKWLDRLANPRFGGNKDKGTVMRIHTATKLRPEERTPAQLNELLAHEARHVAQLERREWSLITGLVPLQP